MYREGQNWTIKHFAWLRAIQRDGALEAKDQVAFGEYLGLLDYNLSRHKELDRQIEALAREPAYKEAVGRLCYLKGLSMHAAMVLLTEAGDLHRFEHPGQFMAYVGLVPSEHSSGGTRRQGSITKAGNSRIRHVLAQPAGHYRGKENRKREKGVDPFAYNQVRLLLASFGYQIMHVLRAVLEFITGTSWMPVAPCRTRAPRPNPGPLRPPYPVRPPSRLAGARQSPGLPSTRWLLNKAH